MDSRPIIFWHKGCLDGFGAAFAAWTHYGDAATYRPLAVDSREDLLAQIGNHGAVLFLDVVPSVDMLKAAASKAMVTVIDHHKTAEPRLREARVMARFDTTHSAAVLTWEYFFDPQTPVPRLLQIVEAYDLWKLTPEVEEVAAGLRSYPFQFWRWHQFVQEGDAGITTLRNVGLHVLRTEKHYWSQAVSQRTQWVTIDGHQVPVVNTNVGMNEAAHALLTIHHTPIAGYYFDLGDGRRKWGLRGNGVFDVSEVAQRFGGGGHHNAAGFTTPLLQPTLYPGLMR